MRQNLFSRKRTFGKTFKIMEDVLIVKNAIKKFKQGILVLDAPLFNHISNYHCKNRSKL